MLKYTSRTLENTRRCRLFYASILFGSIEMLIDSAMRENRLRAVLYEQR